MSSQNCLLKSYRKQYGLPLRCPRRGCGVGDIREDKDGEIKVGVILAAKSVALSTVIMDRPGGVLRCRGCNGAVGRNWMPKKALRKTFEVRT